MHNQPNENIHTNAIIILCLYHGLFNYYVNDFQYQKILV